MIDDRAVEGEVSHGIGSTAMWERMPLMRPPSVSSIRPQMSTVTLIETATGSSHTLRRKEAPRRAWLATSASARAITV